MRSFVGAVLVALLALATATVAPGGVAALRMQRPYGSGQQR
ncbi:hypothetical protein [Streptomyces sp. NRRL S-350]|nr:hypothetical protein [Streptomyces sp. NRRL S-350]